MEFTEHARLILHKGAISCTKEEFEQLVNRMPRKEEREIISVFSYTGPVPRTQKLFGNSDYKYSGISLLADTDIDPLVQRCIDYAKGEYPEDKYPEYEFNGALVNLYEDGKDCVGWHSDNEDTMVPGCPIISVSFGWTRVFKVRTKDKKNNWDFVLENGDVAIMEGKDFQHILQHSVPKVLRKIKHNEDTRRINITVRPFRKK
jgi:alkylated DNA repair dioxygenase AlkB